VNIITFDLDSIEKSFLEELLKYKEAKETKFQIEGNIIVGKLKFVFATFDVVTISTKIYSTFKLNVAMEFNKMECLEQVTLLKFLTHGERLRTFPTEKFVKDFVREIDVIISLLTEGNSQ
jgi:hypothetical protein